MRGFGVDARVLPNVDTDFLHISEAERAELIRSFPSTTEFLKDAFHIRADGERVVKGSAGIPFPRANEHPPMHKYAAIFDRRPCFDGLRRSFFWPTRAGAERRCHYMFEALDRAHDLDPGARAAGGELAAALLAAQEQSNSMPRGFAEAACRAYLRAVQSPEYWFSCEELLWAAECAG